MNVTLQDGDLLAACRGRLNSLDPATGAVQWCNELPGLGYGIMSIAGGSQTAAVVEKKRRDQQAAAAASAGS